MERLAFKEAVDFMEHSQSHWVSHEFRAKTGTENNVQERYRGEKNKQKRNGVFGHLHMLMGCPVGQMML